MALNDYASSRDRGQPVELYQFIYGVEADGVTPIYYAYTDAEAEVTHDGVVYEPLPISRTAIGSKGKMDTNEVRVTVPRISPVAELFRVFPPGRVVTIKIREGNVPNADDPSSWELGENFPVAWLGRVLESSRDGAEAILTCESASASMKRPGLRRHYQWPCPLALYGSRCNADKAAATLTATISAVSGITLTLASGWEGAFDKGSFVGGMVEWAGDSGPEVRSVIRVDTDVLTLTGPLPGLTAGGTVDVVLGCPRTLAACESLHANVVNYGGHPFIPTYNPIHKNNHI